MIMKSTIYILVLFSLFFITVTSCGNEEEIKAPGTVSLVFDHTVGDEPLNLRAPGDQTYDFTDANGQEFNISSFGYYISEIKFISTEGLSYSDPVKITVDASKLTGFYQVLESAPTSQVINVENVTARTYDKVSFVIGVQSYDFIDGPPGGILDPANGAWFLDMETGYVNLAIAGNAANSGQPSVITAEEPEILEGTFSIAVSGWRDVTPPAGEAPFFVDNTKTIELSFDEPISVEDGLNPAVNIQVDLAEILEGIDFSQTFAVEIPGQGQTFSNNFAEAFTLD